MAFSASDAAVEGFRIVRREPLSVLTWALIVLVFSTVSVAVLMPAMAPFATRMSSLPGQTSDPATTLAMLRKVLPIYILMIPVLLASMAVFSCAVYRAVLRPGETGLARLRLGADELRMAGLWVLLGLVFVGALFGAMVVAVIVAAIIAAGIGALAKGAMMPAMFLIIAVFYLAVIFAILVLGVRLSLAGPMTFAERRLRLFASWRMTKGHFWSLLGCYILAFIFTMLLSMVSFALYAAMSIAAAGGSFVEAAQSMFRPEFISLQAYFTPVRIAYLVISSVVSAVYYAVGFAPAAAAYRALSSASPEKRAEVFE